MSLAHECIEMALKNEANGSVYMMPAAAPTSFTVELSHETDMTTSNESNTDEHAVNEESAQVVSNHAGVCMNEDDGAEKSDEGQSESLTQTKSWPAFRTRNLRTSSIPSSNRPLPFRLKENDSGFKMSKFKPNAQISSKQTIKDKHNKKKLSLSQPYPSFTSSGENGAANGGSKLGQFKASKIKRFDNMPSVTEINESISSVNAADIMKLSSDLSDLAKGKIAYSKLVKPLGMISESPASMDAYFRYASKMEALNSSANKRADVESSDNFSSLEYIKENSRGGEHYGTSGAIAQLAAMASFGSDDRTAANKVTLQQLFAELMVQANRVKYEKSNSLGVDDDMPWLKNQMLGDERAQAGGATGAAVNLSMLVGSKQEPDFTNNKNNLTAFNSGNKQTNDQIMRSCKGYLDVINKRHVKERRSQLIRNKISGFIMLTIVFVIVLTLAVLMAFYLTRSFTKILSFDREFGGLAARNLSENGSRLVDASPQFAFQQYFESGWSLAFEKILKGISAMTNYRASLIVFLAKNGTICSLAAEKGPNTSSIQMKNSAVNSLEFVGSMLKNKPTLRAFLVNLIASSAELEACLTQGSYDMSKAGNHVMTFLIYDPMPSDYDPADTNLNRYMDY